MDYFEHTSLNTYHDKVIHVYHKHWELEIWAYALYLRVW